MDLHFTSAQATSDEIAAIETFMSGIAADNKHPRRTYLLPVLHAIQNRIGWISEGALNYASRQLDIPPADSFGVASFYGLLSTAPQPPSVAHVCDDIACKVKGADRLCAELEKLHGPAGSSKDGRTTWHRSPCLGLCEHAPAALIRTAGLKPSDQLVATAEASDLSAALHGMRIPQHLLSVSVPQLGRPVLRGARHHQSSFDDYRAAGGFEATPGLVDIVLKY
jgi:NADH-quinone oxidoreductase subunit F